MANAKNNKERKTLVKGLEVTITTDNNVNVQPFEEYIEYTRSFAKAVKRVSEQRGVSKDTNVVVTVQELVQDIPKQTIYDNNALFENGTLYLNEEDAKAQIATMKENKLVKSYIYVIDGYVWYYDYAEMDYQTKHIERNTPKNLTKIDQRATLKHELQLQYDYADEIDIIATHDIRKTKRECWYIVENKRLEKCIKA